MDLDHFFPLPDRSVIALMNEPAANEATEDAARDFLQGLITQDVSTMAIGEARFGALLSPQGKIFADFFIIRTANGFYLDCATSIAADLFKKLRLYKLRAKIDLALRDDILVTASFSNTEPQAGPDARPDAIVYNDPRLASLGARGLVFDEDLIETNSSADELMDFYCHRLNLGALSIGDFPPDEYFLLDVNYDALNGVDYKKGCFVGQEVTSRMKRKGSIRKRTLTCTTDDHTPHVGDDIRAGDNAIGKIIATTGANSLAIVRLDRLEKAAQSGSPLHIDESTAEIVFPEYLTDV